MNSSKPKKIGFKRTYIMKTRSATRNYTGDWLLLFMLALWCACAGMPAHAQTVEYIHTDALGSPIAVTNANQQVIERSEYAPYGNLLNRPDVDGPGYTGHVLDAATGMSYMQQRYYDPGLGIFLSSDPVSARQNPNEQFNRYRYANGNPYVFRDPDGRCANRYADGTCEVTVEAGTGAAGIAAGKQLEAVLNKFDAKINALGDKSSFAIKDRSGGKIGSLTGKEIKRVWNGTGFNITSKSFNNGGAGGGTSGKWSLFGNFSGTSSLSAKAVGDYMSAATSGGKSADAGVSTLIFHELGHVTKFGLSLVNQYPVTPVISWPRELATSSAAEAMSGSVGAPFDCSIPQGCK